MLPSLVFVWLDRNGKFYVFCNFSKICILIFGSIILIIPILLYFLAMYFSILHSTPPIIMIPFKIDIWHHKFVLIFSQVTSISPWPRDLGVAAFLVNLAQIGTTTNSDLYFYFSFHFMTRILSGLKLNFINIRLWFGY